MRKIDVNPLLLGELITKRTDSSNQAKTLERARVQAVREGVKIGTDRGLILYQ